MSGTSTSQLRYSTMPTISLSAALTSALFIAQPAYASPSSLSTTNQSGVIDSVAGRGWVSSQVAKIGRLSQDWDGYGAQPIQPSVLKAMESLLGSLTDPATIPGSLVPGADGSVQAEWHLEAASFGLLIEEDGTLSCWVQPDGTQEIEKFGLEARELFRSAVISYLS